MQRGTLNFVEFLAKSCWPREDWETLVSSALATAFLNLSLRGLLLCSKFSWKGTSGVIHYLTLESNFQPVTNILPILKASRGNCLTVSLSL